ncbi:hypothetical protein QL285_000793 [Trifolium repens]|nr:hypothetical protein QL285_000793 [Trifolium repens]
MAWVGNIYQKFENMIVEVESTMFEETFQYLENKIQTVGVSVKNFYSDVMEDLIPSSSSSAPVSPIGHHAGAGDMLAAQICSLKIEDCSHSTIIVSHPDVTIEQDHKITRQDNALKLDETCVMITRDKLPSVSDATVNIKTSEFDLKKKWLQPFSLSKKSTRKHEYEELALKHRNDENGKGDRVESLCQTLSEDVYEPEWEFLEIPR